MTALEVQYALTYSEQSPFYIRSHLVFPNVFWGLGFHHELDLLSITMPAHFGTEIEIKVSKYDIKRDLEKRHRHKDSRIRQLYFAGPIELRDAFFEYVPQEAGIITVFRNKDTEDFNWRYQCVIRRKPKINADYRAFTRQEIDRLLRIGNMRYWSLLSRQFKYTDEE
jgi:hypothetical protein